MGTYILYRVNTGLIPASQPDPSDGLLWGRSAKEILHTFGILYTDNLLRKLLRNPSSVRIELQDLLV